MNAKVHIPAQCFLNGSILASPEQPFNPWLQDPASETHAGSKTDLARTPFCHECVSCPPVRPSEGQLESHGSVSLPLFEISNGHPGRWMPMRCSGRLLIADRGKPYQANVHALEVHERLLNNSVA